jgi:aromatic ring-opening dioxygenase catalytic subunit (LigB family)
MHRMPSFFLSHGGGPWPYVAQMRTAMRGLEQSLIAIPDMLPSVPKAILMVSAHWITPVFAISSSARPRMIYDYSGFPENTYRIQYPAFGAPELADRVKQLLGSASLDAKLDAERGFDHGTFVPLSVIYPDAQIPVVQVSVRADMDPAAHFALGRALAPLRDAQVLIIGSGLSFHNMQLFNAAGTSASRAFDAWLQESVLRSTPSERKARLTAWSQAPMARTAHPYEDHLMPLHVALGAAIDAPARCIYHEPDTMGGVAVSSFRFD